MIVMAFSGREGLWIADIFPVSGRRLRVVLPTTPLGEPLEYLDVRREKKSAQSSDQ